jgi:hypothetical protein
MSGLTGTLKDPARNENPVERTTLLELVWHLGTEAESEVAVVAAVEPLLRSGSVRLIGNFRDVPVEQILSAGA